MAQPPVAVSLQLQGLAELRRMREFTQPVLFQKAIALGIKAAGKTAQVQIAKGITSRYTIPSRRIKEDIGEPRFSGNTATIHASPTPLTLNQFQFKPGSRGGPQPGLGRGKGWGKRSKPGKQATAKVFRGKPAKPIKGAFMARGLPMQRVAKGRGIGAIKVLKGPSIARIFTGRGVFARDLQQQAADAIDATFAKTFEKAFRDAERGYGRG
jgi:hypothetical protein